MVEMSEMMQWDELMPELLGLIFGKLSLQEELAVVPLVCKAWAKVIAGPYCWWQIDTGDWSGWRKPEKLDRMIKLLVIRSCGSVHRLAVPGLANQEIFEFIADHAHNLRTLELPMCSISDSVVEQVIPRLSTITFLDISYCQKIGAPGLEAIGKNCESLVGLKRVMHPMDVAHRVSQDDEALAIAATMPKLQHLEVSYSRITTGAVLKIISECRDLEFLDLRGCWEVQLDQKFLKEKYGGLKVLGPEIEDLDVTGLWEDCSDDPDSSVASWEDAYIWDDEEELEGLEVDYHFDDDSNYAIADFGWRV